jgi:DNA ligase D-like protein (predicted polymerase)
VTLELEVDGHVIRVSNPDKPYFPGIAKRDVVAYFAAVGDGLLAAVRDRPTMLERWPGGVSGKAIFQRRPRDVPDWVRAGPDGIHPRAIADLLWAASLGTLRFHPSPVRTADPAHPDELRIDLDPQPGTTFADAVAVARELRGLLEPHGLTGCPKTSGGRGVHVTVPIEPRWSWEEVARAQAALAAELVARMPGLATIERSKRDRGARVYVDHGQFLIAAAYSVRPVPAATVSAPLTWEELEDAAPDDFTVRSMPARFAAVGDLHAGAPAGSIAGLR